MTATLGRLRWLGWAVTAGFLVLAVFVLRDRWDEVVAVGGLPGAVPFAAAVALNVVANGIMVLAWRDAVALVGPSLPFGTAARVWSTSQLTRLAFAVAPIGARPLLGRRHGIPPAVGAVTTVVEVAWLVALNPILLLATAPWWLGGTHGWGWAVPLGALVAVVVATSVLRPDLAIGGVRWLLGLPPLRRAIGERLLAAAAHVAIPRVAAARLAGQYVANHSLRIAAYLVLVAAVGGDLAQHALLAIGAFALGQFVGNLAIVVPGGIGPREGATALVLAPAIGAGRAVVVVTATRLAELLAELAFLALGRALPHEEPASEG